MDAFAYAEKVRLRSAHGNYLCAGSKTRAVVRATRRASGEDVIWDVKQDAVKPVLWLRSCLGGCLTGSSYHSSLGLSSSYKVVTTNPTRADELSDWEPLHQAGRGSYVKLRSRDGTYLRTNGRFWSRSVTHDVDDAVDDRDLLWEVEIVKELGWSNTFNLKLI